MTENLQSDPVVPVLLGLIVIMVAAKLGAIIMERLGQPAVLGELVAGIVAGNLVLLNYTCLEFIKTEHTIEVLAGLGVIILLFEVGLESKITEMLAVGSRSLLVAIVGVITPFLLGYLVVGSILTDLTTIQKIFMGAILTATSVGITARVFKDLNFIKTEEARIVLGAAVIDDILGLIILAIVSALAVSGTLDVGNIITVSSKAFGFVFISLLLGGLLAKRTIKLISVFKLPGMMLVVALTICFTGSYLANLSGLAPIVGAFAAGLVLEDLHFKPFDSQTSIEDYIRPISYFFVPIFFVLTGMKVDLSVFANMEVLSASLAITAIAIVGKLICGWAFTSKTPINRWVIGIGMAPRGEVGLIFATVGKSIGVVNDEIYAITIIMVILTTLVAPPVLNLLIKK